MRCPQSSSTSKNAFGEFENVFHELVSPDIHVDICVVPPSEARDYYTLVTMGMGAHRMNVPEELAEYKLERAELAIALPKDWKLDEESLKDERWYWPIGLLKVLARLPISGDTWLGFGHTMDKQSPFAENTTLCGAPSGGPAGCCLERRRGLHFAPPARRSTSISNSALSKRIEV